MGRERVVLSAQYSPDGPHLQAILDALNDLHDLLDDRLPKPDNGDGEPVPVKEPAPQGQPAEAVPIQEPAPVCPPSVDEDEDEEGPVEVTEPAPAGERPAPTPPPRGGPGSGLPAWQQFADDAEVKYPPDANRDDIIAACERAGVIETR